MCAAFHTCIMLVHTQTHTHTLTLTWKTLWTIFHTSTPLGANTVLQSSLEGQQAGKWPHAVPARLSPALLRPFPRDPLWAQCPQASLSRHSTSRGQTLTGAPCCGQWLLGDVGKKCHKGLWQPKFDPLTLRDGPTGPLYVNTGCQIKKA